MKLRSAFTLIEILIVVVILGIAAAVIVPQLGTRDDLRAAAAARTLMADLIYAQNRAVALQKTHYVIFNTSSGKYDVTDAVAPNHLISQPLTGTPYTVPMNSAPSAAWRSGPSTSIASWDSLLMSWALPTPVRPPRGSSRR